MSYGYRRRAGGRYARRSWYDHPESKLSVIQRNFGGIDEDVRSAFFNLSANDFETVLSLYGKKYGQGPAAYARTAYRRWRNGTTAMSGQTLERLLEVVPYVFSFQTKLGLYRKLRDAHRHAEFARVKVLTEVDIAVVESTVDRIVQRAKSVALPSLVDQRLLWLAQGDGVTARQIVAASEEAEGAAVAEAVRSELLVLQRVLQTLDANHHVEHVIKLPCGTVTVEFVRPKKKKRWWFMSEDQQTQQEGTSLPAKIEGQRVPKDIFEFALQSMIRPEDSQEIVLAAQREYLRLQAKKVEGEMDSGTAERELREFIDQMREANSLSNVSLQADADFKRASGTTRMSVKKSRKWWPF